MYVLRYLQTWAVSNLHSGESEGGGNLLESHWNRAYNNETKSNFTVQIKHTSLYKVLIIERIVGT